MKRFYPVITFTTSFATMGYAMIVASIISDFTGEEILAQCLTMGPYLLGLGLGSFFGDQVESKNQIKTILKLEWLSVLLLPLIPIFIISGIFLFINLSPFRISLESPQGLRFVLSIGGFLGMVSGILGGAQLPLLLKSKEGYRDEFLLAVNYLGPLFAGPFIVLCTLNGMDLSTQIVLIGFVQITGLIFLIGLQEHRKIFLFSLILPMLFLVGIKKYYSHLEFLTIKSAYIGTRLELDKLHELPSTIQNIQEYGELERIKTPYQSLDFFIEPASFEFQRGMNGTLYLNRKPQFDIYSIPVYHETMVHGGINLLGRTPENVLILGAGDGLLLNEVLKDKGIKKVKMIELDSHVINWAKDHLFISLFNRGSLQNLDPRVELVIGDAISELRNARGQEKFDYIMIDFPFPNGHELSKLYSLEFYQLVKRVLSSDGVITIDLPIQLNAQKKLTKESRIIIKTIKASGLTSSIVYGPFASFLSVKKSHEKLEFNYSKMPNSLSLSTKLNLVRIFDENSLSQEEWEKEGINSMFRPGDL